MPNNINSLLDKAKKTAINYGKNSLSVGSILKGLGLFAAGNYIGGKLEKKFRPKDRKKLEKYMYKKPDTKEELKHLGKVAVLGFVPIIGDFSSGVYNGYVTSRTKKRN